MDCLQCLFTLLLSSPYIHPAVEALMGSFSCLNVAEFLQGLLSLVQSLILLGLFVKIFHYCSSHHLKVKSLFEQIKLFESRPVYKNLLSGNFCLQVNNLCSVFYVPAPSSCFSLHRCPIALASLLCFLKFSQISFFYS